MRTAAALFLVRTGAQDPQAIVGQRPRSALASSHGAPSDIALFIHRQYDRHRLGMDRLDHRVRRRGQEAVREVRVGDRLGLAAAISLELGPDAGNPAKRAAFRAS
jgi:hypothetical protein